MQRRTALVVAALTLLIGAAAADEAPCSYIVAAGDSLANVAAKFNLTLPEVLAANEGAYEDVTLIQPGDVIALPCAGNATKGDNILDLLARRNETTVLFRAVVAADLVELLSDPTLEATLFAPNDTSFAILLEALNVTTEGLFEDKPLLMDLLQYHVVPGAALAGKDLKEGMKLDTLLEDEVLEVDRPVNIARIITTGGQRIRVTINDLAAGNATVHIVKRVFIPESAPIDAPPDEDECVHVIGSGENLFVVAQMYGTTVDDLLRLNPVLAANPNSVQIGTEVFLYDSCVALTD